MSADLIQAQYDNLEAIARQFARQAEATAQMQRKVERSMQSLKGGWQGKGSQAFFAEMNGKVLPVTKRLQQALTQAQRETQAIKQLLQTADVEAAKPFKEGEKNNVPTNNGAGGDKGGGLWDKVSGWVHGALDVAGFVPGLGAIPDGINALIYLAEGNKVEAGVAAVAMIPVFGDAAKAGKIGIKAGKELLEEGAEKLAKEGAEKLAKEGGEKLAREAAEKAIIKYVDDPIAKATADKLGNLTNIGSKEARDLIDDLATRSTRGSGDRVVLGEWKGAGNMPDLTNGYIAEATKNGGIYYHVADGVYDGMKKNADSVWAVNEAFLRKQLESGVKRIDFAGGKIDDALAKLGPERGLFKELDWMRKNADKYGYVRQGDSWIYKGR